MAKKVCWLAKESKKGWRLYLCLGEKLTFPIKGLIIKKASDIEDMLTSNIVFAEMDKSRGKS